MRCCDRAGDHSGAQPRTVEGIAGTQEKVRAPLDALQCYPERDSGVTAPDSKSQTRVTLGITAKEVKD